jgi:Immunoglobulin I-set domain
MRRSIIKKLAVGLVMMGWINVTQAQWQAFNDNDSGPGTSANATLYNNLGAEGGLSGFLRNVLTGANLPVRLTITTNPGTGFLRTEAVSAPPAPGTPLANTFDGYVDFTTDVNIALDQVAGQSITYTFSGLNPTKKYILQGGAIRGNPAYTTRYTLFQLNGATSFTSAHSAGCLTTTQVPSLLANQVAINTGYNSTPETGDMFDWEEINPGSDGTFAIFCRSYNGSLPGGGTAFRAGYALTAVKLVEAVNTPVSILTQPMSQTVNAGDSATFSVIANGFPIFYQWLKNGAPISGANGPNYTVNNVTPTDGGTIYSVIISNSFSMVKSSDALLVVTTPPVTLVPWDQVWHYQVSGTDLGTGWKDPSYVDTSWPSGRGPLGFETAVLPVPLATTFSSNNKLIYYFRTKFVFDGEPTDVELVLTNMLDDGGVFYLNGEELVRVRMPAGTIDANTTTVAPAVGDAALEVLMIPNTLLRPGTNYFAVEMHQINTTSSDLVFGTTMVGTFLAATPLKITKQPQDQTVEEFKSVDLTVGISGNGARFQWYRNNMPVNGATFSTYSIPSASFNDSGVYHVEVSNLFGGLTSRDATLTVLIDTNGPTLVDADGTLNTTNITVSFSEKVSPTQATISSNYRLTTTGGGNFQVFSAVLTNGTNVILTTAARVPNTNYLVQVNGIRDISPQANLIAPNSKIPVATLLQLVRLTDSWKFYDPFPDFPLFEPLYPGNGWNQIGFNDSQWGTGGSAFIYDNDPNKEYPVLRGTELSQGSLTKYFRTTFDYQASTLGARFRMRHVVDDGAIFYINGTEFLRFNLPASGVDETTPASAGIGIANFVDVNDIPTDQLRVGQNLLAVELHGVSALDLDWCFAMDFQARVNSLGLGTVVITEQPKDVTVIEGQAATFSYNGAGPLYFQWYTNNVPMPGATNASLTIPFPRLAMSGMTFHVVMSNDTSSATSSNAVLTVLSDNIAPTLVSAVRATNINQVIVTFSEGMDPVSATVASHYMITNSTGQTLQVLSAVLASPTVVYLNVGQMQNQGYVLRVKDIGDAAVTPNLIAPFSGATIAYEVLLVDIDTTHMWKYEDTGTDLGTNWKERNFNDSTWPSGPALLGFETATLPQPIRTQIDYTVTKQTYYFRTHFNLLGNPENAKFRIREIIDDGAVYYLNGVDFHRIGMPIGPITFDTIASRTIGDAEWEGPYTEDVPSLVQGDNVIAAEAHQHDLPSSDIVFGAQITAVFPSILLEPPELSCPPVQVTRMANGQVQVSWAPGGTCVLQQADEITGPWSNVSNPSNPYLITPTAGSKKFYKLASP